MATKFTEFVWPPLLFPLPVPTGMLGPKQVSPVWPKFPPPLPTLLGKIGPLQVSPTWGKMPFLGAAFSLGKNGGIAPPPSAPSRVAPVALVSKTTFTAAAAPALPKPNSIIAPSVTQAATLALFRIISPNPGT